MSEKDNLPEAEEVKNTEVPSKKIAETTIANVDQLSSEESPSNTTEDVNTEVETIDATLTPSDQKEDLPESNIDNETSGDESTTHEDDDALNEIDASNAKEAESDEGEKKDTIEEKDYSSMSMETLVEELESLMKNEQIQRIKRNVESIRKEFNGQFSKLLEQKKQEFLDEGGNSIDFRFDFPLKKTFNSLFKEYREKRQSYYNNLQETFKANLENRLEVIEEIKGLLNVEENINTTYKQFKALQERWRNIGGIPRDKYNNVWNNYHHHVENFYDFLHLNRDLRDLDFKHNLEQKLKIIESAEELAKDDNSNRAFRELQALHKMWKEELGPVAKEHRDEIWERFRAATKTIHDKRQEYFKKLDEVYLKNLEVKNEIIAKIYAETENKPNSHSQWQKKIKAIEELRQEFFNAGKVPIKVNEATWAKFKEAVRGFNRSKNAFYKDLKKEQYTNLQKKMELIKIAEENKDSEDYEVTTPLMKKIQNDWKKIGHVPRRESDKIWNQFKEACNHYFNRFHEQRNTESKEELESYNKKNDFLDGLKKLKFGKDLDENLTLINAQIEAWRDLGKVPHSKRYIEGKFGKAIDGLYGKLDVSPDEIELLKYDNKLESLKNSGDKRLLDNEHNFIRKRIDEIESEINQLENNMQFFSNVDDDNPLVKDVLSKIESNKGALSTWRSKLNRVKKFY